MKAWRKVCTWNWVVAVVALAAEGQAVTVINKNTGQVLFYDDFENASAVSKSAYPDSTGDYDSDHPTVGTWSMQETGPTNIQVAAYFGDGTNDPAATPQGANYLRVVRHTAAVTEADTIISSVQTNVGDVIHMETMVWIPSGAKYATFQIQFIGSAGSTDFRANVVCGGDNGMIGNVYAWDTILATPAYVDTLLDWQVNTWQKWEVDYAIGADVFDVTIDGVKKTLNRSGPAGNIKTIAFRGGSMNDNIQFRLDATGYDGTKQDSLTLFRDGFEGGTSDTAPGMTIPEIGTYRNVGSGVKVRTGDLSASGGPPAACSGNNYVEFTRTGGLATSLSCMFAGGAVDPDAQELCVRFQAWWGGAGIPSHGIGTNTTSTFDSGTFLTFGAMWTDRGYRAYSGTGYTQVAPADAVPTNTWFPVEIVWYPKTQTSTVSIDGGTPLANVLFGDVPEILCQLFLGSSSSATVYWVDDIEIHWVYTAPPPQGTVVKIQ